MPRSTSGMRGVWTDERGRGSERWGMYSAFVLLPEYVEAPVRTGGFGTSVGAAGLYLVPWTAAVAVASAVSGRLSTRYGSRIPLVVGNGGKHRRLRVAGVRPLAAVGDTARLRDARCGDGLCILVDGQSRDRERADGSDRCSQPA